jgi:hypothetical protein
MYMKRLHWASLIILVIAVTTFIHFNNLIEGYRGGGGHGGGHHDGHGRGYYRSENINYMRHPSYHYRNHNGNRGYTWHNPWYVFRGNACKNGCTNIGNGNWGCQNPGYGANDCWFSSDCDEC